MHLIKTLIILLVTVITMPAAATQKNSFQVLCYHNVVDTITDPQVMNLTTDQLIAQFKWLKKNNYTVISIDDILQAKQGKKTLPKHAVLLTFDDGYSSFYTRIYPLLKLYNYPAVYGLVGKWQETPYDKSFAYGNITKSRNMLLTWEQINEMIDSGLVEIASHSYNAHHGTPFNPQGNTRPFYTTLIYDKKQQKYEDETSYLTRVEADIKRSSETIFEHTGTRPRVMLWPYGAYNYIVQKLAAKYGMTITATLDNGVNTPDNLPALKRVLIGNNANFDEFFWSLQNYVPDPQRALYIDPQEIYDPDPKVMEHNLGLLIEQIRQYKASTVFVKGYADTDHDGLADMLYFPNKELPMRADILGRMLWQIKRRANVTFVHAWMPLSAFEINNKALSLRSTADKNRIKNIYYALAKYNFFQGILFDNTNKHTYQADTIISMTKTVNETIKYFTRHYKSSLLIPLDSPLMQRRDYYAKLLDYFDYVAVDTKKQIHSKKQLHHLVDTLKASPNALKKTAFKFREYDYSRQIIAEYMRELLLNNAMNLGYERRHYLHQPSMPKNEDRAIVKIFSLESNPFE